MKIAQAITLFLHFFCAGIVSAIVAIIMHTQVVLAELTNIQIKVTLSDRLYMSIQDLIGLMPKYGIVVLIGLAVAFVITKSVTRFIGKSIDRFYLYPLAGGVAMLAILLAMQPILNITLLAGARTVFGIFLQIIAGILGGYIFGVLRRKNQHVKQIPHS